MESPAPSNQGPANNAAAAINLEATQAEAKKDKTITIVVNGSPHEVPKKDELTFDEVVDFVDPTHLQHPEITYSVTYTRGDGHKPEGILSPGGTVKAKDGMSFVVNRTGQS